MKDKMSTGLYNNNCVHATSILL